MQISTHGRPARRAPASLALALVAAGCSSGSGTLPGAELASTSSARTRCALE